MEAGRRLEEEIERICRILSTIRFVGRVEIRAGGKSRDRLYTAIRESEIERAQRGKPPLFSPFFYRASERPDFEQGVIRGMIVHPEKEDLFGMPVAITDHDYVIPINL